MKTSASFPLPVVVPIVPIVAACAVALAGCSATDDAAESAGSSAAVATVPGVTKVTTAQPNSSAAPAPTTADAADTPADTPADAPEGPKVYGPQQVTGLVKAMPMSEYMSTYGRPADPNVPLDQTVYFMEVISPGTMAGTPLGQEGTIEERPVAIVSLQNMQPAIGWVDKTVTLTYLPEHAMFFDNGLGDVTLFSDGLLNTEFN